MGMLDMATYTQLQAADALRDAAQNPSGGAGLTAGIGAGVGVGSVIASSLQGMTGTGGTSGASGPQSQPPAGGAPGSIPDVMTPAEAAAILRVSEEDVLASITSGDLKARKLGSAYRISKEALEQFLKG
jgi:excisionase family DNA binding protein